MRIALLTESYAPVINGVSTSVRILGELLQAAGHDPLVVAPRYPGYTDTDLVSQSLKTITARSGRSRDEALGAMLRDSPLGRLVQPDEVAAAVLSLCSQEAAAVTGTTLVVAGGEV